MEQKIVLSSQRAREIDNNNKPNDFVTVFDRPVVLDKNKQYLIALDKVNTMTYSWHNVGPDYNNNIIVYYKDYDFEPKRIKCTSGTYDFCRTCVSGAI